ncbi:MAG: oligosaccharide flippase family protein [Candidatus Hydrogenedentes bacterium]|nr:oligosaccharide flippase family protein [Candidatus Hydrogenedentota bacterium]
MTQTPAKPRASWLASFSSLFIARVVASAATFLVIAILGRTLGRAHYGDFVILITIVKVAAELFSPALDIALVRFSGAAKDNAADAAAYARAVLRAKLLLAAVTLLMGAAILIPLHHLVFAREGVEVFLSTLALAFTGAALMIVAMYVPACFQARQHFTACAVFEVASALLRLAAIATLAYTQHDSIGNLFLAYTAAPVLVAALASLWLPSTPRVSIEPRIWRDLVGFAKWVAVACLCTSLLQRLDVFIVAAYKLPAEAISDYGAALQLTLLGDLVNVTLFTILLPHASSLATRDELRAFLRGFRMPTLFAFLSLVILTLCSGIVARLTFGAAYAQTGHLFAILLVGAAFAVGSAPAGAALYGLGKSRSIALIEFAKLAGILIGGILFVPRFGVIGMAWTVALVKGGAGVLTYALAITQTK